MDDRTLAAVSDENLAFAIGELARCSPDGEASTTGGVRVSSVGIPIAFFNQVQVLSPLDDPVEALGSATTRMRSRGVPFVVVVAPALHAEAEVLATIGFTRPEDGGTIPGMALDPIVGIPPLPVEPTFREVQDEDDYWTWNAVSNAGFGIPTDAGVRIGSPRLLDIDEARLFLGHLRSGEPVCTGAMIEAPTGVAGVYNIATVDPHRRRGFGEAMTWHVIRVGRDRGCTTAVLQSSELGRRIYERMGFRLIRPYEVYAPA